MNKEEIYEISFQLILHSGNARSLSMEAIYEAKNGNIDGAREKICEAEMEFNKAHRFQTELIQGEASGEAHDIPILLIHAQDHLMNALTVKDMATEFIELYKKLS
ncbi:PTS lactose/cellobiose transporter subunit IIA [Neobacillus sp. CF12]|uniref:PTS lactose/cellobiose transporter subunit IIA n=1 Tax=Neobacillus sp. CF12 TaxID=3055864 RepID=UPI0025A110E6|nr:PTS lactose/cellobiose transporter subunit IIA [Neobacillus sp. CF12]MDM5328565.1 PTS lactose/cellobiose transporter subunit IIA [Neobacillus sp. CF12]